MRDIRLALRSLRRHPVFALTAILATALGIGAVTVVASLADGVLFRPYPYRQADRLVLVTARDPARGATPVAPSIADYLDLRARTQSFASLASFVTLAYNLPGDGTNPAIPVQVNFMSADLLRLLGVAPALGRGFAHAEEPPGDDLHPVVISHDLWRRRFGGDAGILGRTVLLDTTRYTVIGIMPQGFRFGYAFAANADAWAPLESWLARYGETMRGQGRSERAYYRTIARLADGVSEARARDELERIGQQLTDEFPATNRDVSFDVVSLRQAETGPIAPYLRLVGVAVALLLLMACANVAGLLLVRATGRRVEVATRLGLGASSRDIVREWLAESIVIGVVGALVGAVLAAFAVEGVDRAIPVEQPAWMVFAVDWRITLIAGGIGLAAGVLCGLLPAWLATRVPLAQVLREDGRAGGGRSDRLRRVLVVGQVALACLLLAAAGVLIRSLWEISTTAPGLQTERLLAAYVSPPGDKYRDEGEWPAYASLYRAVLDRLRALPEVEAAGGMNRVPFDGESMPDDGLVVTREGDTLESQQGAPSALLLRASHDAFDTAGIPLLQGRVFREDETRAQPLVAIVSRAMADRYWPGESPIGKRVKPGPADEPGDWYTVVGMVGDVRFHGASRAPHPVLYRPYTQVAAGDFHFLVRTRAADPATALDVVRRTIAAVDPYVAVYHVRPMSLILANASWQACVWALVCGAFAVGALLLSMLGVYSVTATSVAARQSEFGVRLALGAAPGAVARLVQSEVSRLLALGIVFGSLGVAVSMPQVRGLLATPGSQPVTPLIVAVAAVVALVGLAAGWWPARRAGRTDPARVLRR